MYRRTGPRLEVLLVHPGGPFWRSKDEGAWSIPKGEMAEDEDAAVALDENSWKRQVAIFSGPLSRLATFVSVGASA